MQKTITIALATYQGAKYLAEQLASIAAQTYPKWRLLVSDDGSTDGTRDIIAEFATGFPQGQVSLVDGPAQGATANFLHLTRHAPADSWFAYSDQDDVWHPDKLARAAAFLTGQNGPAAYAARTTICDTDLTPLRPAPAYVRPLAFSNALIQACMPGNTLVTNSAALKILQEGAPAALAAGVISHDWWVYQLLSGAGAVLTRDRAQVLAYRQHPANVMGRNDTAKARAARFSMLTDGTFAGWLSQNQAALQPVAHLLTPENRALLTRFDALRQLPGPAAMREMIRMKLYRQTTPGTIAVLGATLMGRLRKSDVS